MNRQQFRKLVAAVKLMEAKDFNLFPVVKAATPEAPWTKAFRVYLASCRPDPTWKQPDLSERTQLYKNGKGILLDMPNGFIRPKACTLATQEAAK